MTGQMWKKADAYYSVCKNKTTSSNVPDPSPLSTQMPVGWGTVWLARLTASYSRLYEEGEVDHINCLASFLNL